MTYAIDKDEITEGFRRTIQNSIRLGNTFSIKWLLQVNLERGNQRRTHYILDALGVPANLSLKERVAFYQLLEKP